MFCLLFGHRSCLSTRIFDFTDIFFFNLQASLSSAMNSLSDMTPILSKRESRGGVGAEESSDDEMGSVSFQKKYFVNRCHVKKPFFFLQQISARSHEDNSGASSSISTTSSVMYPPNAMEPRRYVYFVTYVSC